MGGIILTTDASDATKAFQKEMKLNVIYGRIKGTVKKTRINVYGDGDCLYYVVIMGLLLNKIDSEPVKNLLKKNKY